jgi:hypothetical protein
METASFSEMLASAKQSTRRFNTKTQKKKHQNFYRRENLKTRAVCLVPYTLIFAPKPRK